MLAENPRVCEVYCDFVFGDLIGDVVVVCDDICCCCACGHKGDILVCIKLMIVCGCVLAE